MREVELQSQASLERQSKKFTIRYGNEHSLLNRVNPASGREGGLNKHQWRVFVRCSTSLGLFVEKVKFGIDPSFGKTERVVIKPPFEFSAVGWGTFDIPITIYWKRWLQKEPTELCIIYLLAKTLPPAPMF